MPYPFAPEDECCSIAGQPFPGGLLEARPELPGGRPQTLLKCHAHLPMSVLVPRFKAHSRGPGALGFSPSAFKEDFVLLPLSLSLPVEKDQYIPRGMQM